MNEKTGPTHQPRRTVSANVCRPEDQTEAQRLQQEIDALKNSNAQIRAQQELFRRRNRLLAGRDEPLTAPEQEVFQLQVAVTNARADAGFEQQRAKVARRREKGPLVHGWAGNWSEAKGRWTEEG